MQRHSLIYPNSEIYTVKSSTYNINKIVSKNKYYIQICKYYVR